MATVRGSGVSATPANGPFAKAADFVEFSALRAILNKSTSVPIFEAFPLGPTPTFDETVNRTLKGGHSERLSA